MPSYLKGISNILIAILPFFLFSEVYIYVVGGKVFFIQANLVFLAFICVFGWVVYWTDRYVKHNRY